VYIAKLAPPTPRKNKQIMNTAVRFLKIERIKPQPNEHGHQHEVEAKRQSPTNLSAKFGRTTQPMIVPLARIIVP
jgi:hypothetical protein